jgi:hypothetical protein
MLELKHMHLENFHFPPKNLMNVKLCDDMTMLDQNSQIFKKNISF